MDGATDDQAAAQKAVDAFTKAASYYQHAGIVEITGGMAIGSTLTINNQAIRLRGQGWGSTANSQVRSYIKWIGSAGSPVILIKDCQGASVEDIRVIGKSSAKPSAGIEFRDTSTIQAQDFGALKNVYIGHFYGYDSDQAEQFTAGLLLSGSVNGDHNKFDNIAIAGCAIGVDIQNPNATTTHFGVLTITDCGTGIKTKTDIVLDCWQNGINDIDLEFAYPGVFVDVRLFQSEGAGRMCKFNGHEICSLIVRSGSFGNLATTFTPADSGNNRWMIDAGDVGICTIQLENFAVVTQGVSPKNHVIRAGHTSNSNAPLLRLIDVVGIDSTNILLGLAGSGDKNKGPYVEILKRRSTGVQAHEYSRNFIDANRTEDRDFQNLRVDYLGKVNIFGGPHKVKKLSTPTGVTVTPTGSGATTYSYRVSALTYDGETEATAGVTCVNNATLSGSAYNTVAWVQSQGAYAYKIYGRTSGTELLMKTLSLESFGNAGLTWADTGVDTPSGALPTINTTGNASVEGIFSSGSGAAVASATTIVPTGNIFHVTGTTTITSVSGTGITAGTVITIIFVGILTFTDGSNLKLAGNFVTSADDTITLMYDGTNYYELCRSVN